MFKKLNPLTYISNSKLFLAGATLALGMAFATPTYAQTTTPHTAPNSVKQNQQTVIKSTEEKKVPNTANEEDKKEIPMTFTSTVSGETNWLDDATKIHNFNIIDINYNEEKSSSDITINKKFHDYINNNGYNIVWAVDQNLDGKIQEEEILYSTDSGKKYNFSSNLLSKDNLTSIINRSNQEDKKFNSYVGVVRHEDGKRYWYASLKLDKEFYNEKLGKSDKTDNVVMRSPSYTKKDSKVKVLIDKDNDGFRSDVDCNEENEYINPKAIDIPNDGIDQNCDGIDSIIENNQHEDVTITVDPVVGKTYKENLKDVKKLQGLRRVKIEAPDGYAVHARTIIKADDGKRYVSEPINFEPEIICFNSTANEELEDELHDYWCGGPTFTREKVKYGDTWVADWHYSKNMDFPRAKGTSDINRKWFWVNDTYLPNGKLNPFDKAKTDVVITLDNLSTPEVEKIPYAVIQTEKHLAEQVILGYNEVTISTILGNIMFASGGGNGGGPKSTPTGLGGGQNGAQPFGG